MYISGINRAVSSFVAGVAIILGSAGFVIQTHECQHSVSKVYVLAGHAQQESRCCDHVDFRCCESETDHNLELCGYTDSLNEETCCKHEVEVIQLPGFTLSDKNIERDIPLITESLAFFNIPGIKRTNIQTDRPFHNKHGGKDILIQHCQSLT